MVDAAAAAVAAAATAATAAAAAVRSEIFGVRKATHVGSQDADAKNSKLPSAAGSEFQSLSHSL